MQECAGITLATEYVWHKSHMNPLCVCVFVSASNPNEGLLYCVSVGWLRLWDNLQLPETEQYSVRGRKVVQFNWCLW